MPSVQMDGMLREFAPRLRLSSEAGDVRSLLEDLETRFPRLRLKLRDETGTVRQFVKVYVNGEEIRGLSGLDTPVRAADRVDILHSIQGG
jgi:molybdopterin synthase sulfur carrier subunit